MIKFNFTFKIIKKKPEEYSLTKKAPPFRDKSKALKGKKGKRRRCSLDGKQFMWTWHMTCSLAKNALLFLEIKAKRSKGEKGKRRTSSLLGGTNHMGLTHDMYSNKVQSPA